MKTTITTLSLIALASCAQAALVTGWVTTNGDAGYVGGSEATGSPVTTDADGDAIAANFPAVTLADGDSLTLSGTASFNASLAGNQFRVGLFNSDNPATTGVGGGYIGVYIQAGSGTTGGPVDLANGTATNPFSGSAATAIGTMSAPGITAAANSTINFLLTIARNGGNLDISGSYSDGGSYNSTVALTGEASTYYTYNSAAFLMGGSLNATQGTYSNIDVTYSPIPEPSAAVLGLLGACALIRRRRA